MASLGQQAAALDGLIQRLAADVSERAGRAGGPEADRRDPAARRATSRQRSTGSTNRSATRSRSGRNSAARVDEAADLHRRLVELLTPLLDDATLYLVTGYRTLGDAAPQTATNRLTERTLLTYAAMSQLSIEANLLGALAAEATDLPDTNLIPPLIERFQSAADRFDRAIGVIGPGGLQSVQDTAAKLVAIGLGPDNVYELRRSLLDEQQAAATRSSPRRAPSRRR